NGEKVDAVSLGPWGGQGGKKWDDGLYSGVRQLLIAHGSGVDSLQFEYDNKGASIWSHKHGGTGGTKTDKVKLDYPNEYLTSINGYYGSLYDWGPVMIRSLTFETNKAKYGPYGDEQGTYFSLRTQGGKIIGFHGRGDWYLDAIGIKYQKSLQQNHKAASPPSNALVQANCYNVNSGAATDNHGYSVIQGSAAGKTEGYLKHGPWGGQGGSAFDDGTYSGIRQIYVSRNVGIVYLRAQYDRDGQPVWGSRHGGTGGFKTDKIVFDYPQEILTHITGTYGPLMHMGPNIVKSLTFFTNKGKHGPFGEEHGPSFFSKVNEGRIVGFHGREGLFLDAIGVHVKEGIVNPPKNHLSDAIVKFGGAAGQVAEQVAYGVVKESIPFGPGPWGGDGGRPWDDGVFSGIQQIFLTRTVDAICSIQIEYDRSGQSVWSVKHGSNTGTSTHRVKLEYPHETLVSISGYYGPTNREDKLKVVRSLSFQTTRGKLGPFGEEVGTFFTSSTAEGKVVGFHGRSGAYLDAIGLHMQYWLGSSNKPTKTSLFRRYG
ncbi:Jacalin-related lectin 3, partial [Linum perenne]